jgi:DNA invertase Pin-like site-specific DNA recombinase
MPLRVAAYCRVSTDKEEQLSSLESQRKYFVEYIEKAEDWDLVEVYYDEGVSGTSTRHREGFQRMMEDVYAGRIQLIITKEVSRFARNTVDTLSYTRQLKGLGVGVLFINDNINTLEPDGELRLTIMASIAQEESRKTSERVKWGQKRRMEQGVVFGRSMLGYDVRNGKLYINPEGADIVRLIFHKYVNENKGTHVIARELLEAGIYPMRIKEWKNTVILRVLRNEKYVGDLLQKKTYTPDYLTHSKKYNRGAEEKVYIRDHHEPIISREMWDKAQGILADRTLTDEQKLKHSCRYWCSGKIRCGECGGYFVSRTKKLSDGSIYKAWRCAAAARHGVKKLSSKGIAIGCDGLYVNEQVLIESVGYVLKHLKINRKCLIAEMEAELKAVISPSLQIDVKEFEKNISKLEEKKHLLLDRFLEGIVSEEDYKRQNSRYDEQIADYKQKIANQEYLRIEFMCQAHKIKECIEQAKKMLDFECVDKNVCGEVIEGITAYKGNILEVKLKYVPAVRLKFSTYGRGNGYRVMFEVI